MIVRSITIRVFLFTQLCDGENIQTEQNRLFIFVLEFVEFLDLVPRIKITTTITTYVEREYHKHARVNYYTSSARSPGNRYGEETTKYFR